VYLEANDFNFDDLTTFVPATKILKGNLTALIEGSGTINDLDIATLRLKYGKTLLQTTGKLRNLDKPSTLMIHARFKDSFIREDDVSLMLPALDLPKYKGFDNLTIDSLTYDGTPFKFTSIFKIQAASGVIRSTTSLDYSGDYFIYDISLNAGNLDLEQFAHHPITFNGEIKAKGKGVNPKTASINYAIDGKYTVIGRQVFSTLHMDGEVKDAELKTSLTAKTNIDSLLLTANINFSNDSLPVYNAYLRSNHMDLNPILMDSSLTSDINGEVKIAGRGFNPDKISGKADIHINNSTIADKIFEDFVASINMESANNLQKHIVLSSEILDGSVSGRFSLTTVGEIASRQFGLISNAVRSKLQSYFPNTSAVPVSTLNTQTAAKPDSINKGDYNVDIVLQPKRVIEQIFLNFTIRKPFVIF